MTGFNADRLARLPAFIKARYLDTGRLPHAAMLVSHRHETVHLSVQGDARPGEPLKEDAIFRIASMTKPITSVVFMQLVEEGKVALADPVHRFIPEWKGMGVFVAGGGDAPFQTRPTRDVMRIIDLLRHTAGFTYGFQERNPVDAVYRKHRMEARNGPDLEEMIRILAGVPLVHDPAASWNYGISVDVLGAIIQRIEDKPLDQVFAERLFGPLGMIDTMFTVDEARIGRVPDCYMYHPAETMRMYDPGATTGWAKPPKQLSGGGGLLSTLADYHRFCRMMLAGGALDGTRILSRKTVDLMTANHLPGGGDLTTVSSALFSEAENAGTGFGLGFAVTIDPAATQIPCSKGDFYWGGMFSTAFWIDPVEDVIAVFMTQLMPSMQYPIRREIKTLVYSALD